MWTNADLLALKAELTNDPASLGLTTLPADDEANANKLNEVRATISVKKRSVTTAAIFNAIDPIEHQALSDQQARWLGQVLTLGQIDPFTSGVILDGINEMFAANTVTRPAVAALMNESGSRIEKMFQDGTLSQSGTVTPSDIANARNAT